MNRLKELINDGYILTAGETSNELVDIFKDIFDIPYLPMHEHIEKLLVFVLLQYNEHDFEITFSDDYETGDHRFWGNGSSYPCKTMFIHSSIDEIDENLEKIRSFVLKIKGKCNEIV